MNPHSPILKGLGLLGKVVGPTLSEEMEKPAAAFKFPMQSVI
jgi:hypothetical protein